MKQGTDMALYVTDKHYDISGQEIVRIGKHYFISKLSRYENLSGGPGLKCLMVLFVLHRGGWLSSWLLSRFEGKIKAYLHR